MIDLSKNRPPQAAERIDAISDEDSIAMSFIPWAELQQWEALRRLVPVLHPDGPGICEHDAVQATALKRHASAFSRVEKLQLEDWAV